MQLVLILLLAIVVLAVLGAAVVGVAVQLLWWALIGLAIGALARLLVPRTAGMSLLATVLFGVGGALLGGIIANAADAGTVVQFIIAVLVAAVLIAIFGGTRRNVVLTR